MTSYLPRISGFILLAAGLVLGACEGDTGPQGLPGVDGADGLGFVPMPAADQALGEYDSNGTPVDGSDDPPDQQLFNQLALSSGVWEIALDHQVQIDRGDGTPPTVADTVIFDSDHNELWLMIDGVPVALTDKSLGLNFASIGCVEGAPLPCVEGSPQFIGSYAAVFQALIEHGPAVETQGFGVFGVKTAAADMPSAGSADYSGPFTAEMTGIRANGASFLAGFSGTFSGTIADWATPVLAWSVTDPSAGDVDNLALSGDLAVTGNSYAGSITGTGDLDGDSTTTGDALVFGGSAEGTFYGPAPDAVDDAAADPQVLSLESETAGVFSFADADATDADLGGDGSGTSATGTGVGAFLGVQDSFAPPPPAPAAE